MNSRHGYVASKEDCNKYEQDLNGIIGQIQQHTEWIRQLTAEIVSLQKQVTNATKGMQYVPLSQHNNLQQIEHDKSLITESQRAIAALNQQYASFYSQYYSDCLTHPFNSKGGNRKQRKSRKTRKTKGKRKH